APVAALPLSSASAPSGNSSHSAVPALPLPYAPATFTETARLTLLPGEDWMPIALFDPLHGLAYFVSDDGHIVAIRLSDFTRVDGADLGVTGFNGGIGVVDAAN